VESEGEVCFKIYGGGVMGDEPAMVRKMRTGQLDAAAITSVGLSDINKHLLVLQLPLLFKNYKELDYVRDKMHGRLTGLLEAKGFQWLGWGDVGFVYLFSNEPIAKSSDIKRTKLWVWDNDAVTKEVANVAGVNAIYLGVPDVLPSLSTGIVNAYLNSPYGAIALQWHTKTKFVTDLKLAVTIGGTVMSDKGWAKLSDKQKAIVKEVSVRHHQELLKKIRRSNKSSKKKLVEKYGYTPVAPENFSEWSALAAKARQNLTGKLFPADLVKEVEMHLKAVR
jgi:TRAP-type C4-dicarboxylate transport system substrate-binding protein